jgi:hypothetical protein
VKNTLNYISFFVFVLLMVGCAPEAEEKIKDLNDILPNAERDYDQKDSTNVKNTDTLEVYRARFETIGTVDSILPYEEDLFPDRVGPEGVEKFVLNIEGEETIFVKWRFSDSLRVTNALFNWLDCFGPSCKFIRVGEESNLQRNAFHVLANDTVLIYLESENKLDPELWDEYFEKQGYELDWNYRMEQTPRRKVQWFEYIEEEKTPVKNEEL